MYRFQCCLSSQSTNKRIFAQKVLGGNGYMGEYGVEQLWRDSKLLEIGGGTNEAHHKNMTRDLNRFPEVLS